MSYLDGLNERQREAVLHVEGPLLIVAGAGAGKTKTITHRIAHLIESGVAPHHILALTFTNKAAGEMRERVRTLLKGRSGMPLLTTFHSLGVRLLREFHKEAEIPRGFSIWDRDDSMKALKAILTKLGSDLQPKNVLAAISRQKGDGVSGAEYAASAKNYREQGVARAWDLYEKTLKEEGALDFDDLLLRTLRLLQSSPAVLSLLQDRWTHITIDEYQDTNRSQYEIARLLAGKRQNICVVGDTDQCVVSGTGITMADGSVRPVESVKKGDMVLSNYGSGDMRGARVTGTFSRERDGECIQITTRGGRIVTSTPEHIHFAGYKLGLAPQLYFTYLMHKAKKGFRLGVSQVYTKGQRKPMLGFQQRCNHEHADDVWILAAHRTPQEARILEYRLSLEYKIPTLPFVARKGLSTNGYVHDQRVLDEIFGAFDTEKSAEALFKKYGLSRRYPHHRAQSTRGRNNIVVTLCGDRRGKTPMHRLAMAVSDPKTERVLLSLGFSLRHARAGSLALRFETAHKHYGELRERVDRIRSVLPDAAIIEMARLGGKKKKLKDGNSLPFLPAASVRAGMAVFDETGGYDIVERVERVSCNDTRVYDLNIEHTHNFIANGIITHNSIYTWRGADIEHLLGFEAAFPGTKVVTLEQNYRSTRTILSAANTVIGKNMRRKPKTLFTENATGEPISFYGAQNETDEAWFVVQHASQLIERGTSPANIAVLYRENFQSRVLEEAFLHAGVPYRVLGTRFFERKEVKDVLSYLRAALNPASRNDIARIIAVPPRGIGKVTLDKMFAGNDAAIPSAARAKVEAFRTVLLAIRKAAETVPASQAVRFAIEASGIEKMLKKDTEEGAERLLNVQEFVNLSTKYDDAPPPEGIERLLEEAALQSEQDDPPAGGETPIEAVSLMTVHASKGLEFDAVFVTGLEYGLFPSEREGDPSADGQSDPEEERRLFYVAITRAAERLYLSYARERMKYGSRESAMPSEFLSDIDTRLIAAASYAEETEDTIE